MCYTLRDSQLAFGINLISSCLLYYKAYKEGKSQLKVLSLLFMFIGVMQFWDILFWTYPPDTLVNLYATKLAMIWNNLEPIVMALLIYFFLPPIDVSTKIIVGLYAVVVFCHMIYIWNSITSTEVCCDGNSLLWKWNYSTYSVHVYAYFLFTLLFLCYQYLTGTIRIVMIGFVLATYTFSLYKHEIRKNTGRFWCYFAAFGPILFMFL